MPAYNGNNIYLNIGGIEVQSEFKTVNLSPSIESVETTRGAGRKHRQRNTGLEDTSMSATIGYQTEKIQQQIKYLKPGEYDVVFGSEGPYAGKPKHVQRFILNEAPLEITVEKGEVVFELSFEAADEPIQDMYLGATF